MFIACMLSLSPLGAAAGVHTWADTSALASGTWVKVALDGDAQDGIYQISYRQLRQWGFERPENVGVYGYGGHPLSEAMADGHIDDVPEVAVLNDTEGERILFYGRGLVEWRYLNATYGFVHRRNAYSTQACYFLHEKDEPSRPMQTLAQGEATGEEVLVQFDEHQLHESEQVNIGMTGREFYGESFLYTQTQSFRFEPLFDAGEVQVTLNFVAASDKRSSISVRLNDEEAGSGNLETTSGYFIARELTFNRIVDFPATSAPTVGITYSPGDNPPSIARLNYIRLQGKRTTQLPSAASPFMLFRYAEAMSRRIGARVVPTDDVQRWQVWDVTDPVNVCIQPLDEAGDFYTVGEGIHEYALVNLGGQAKANFPGVKRVGEVANQNLHALPQSDLLIVTATAFRSQAEELAAYRRQHDGLTVSVVTDEEIYNEFSSGSPDATAIRLACKMLYDRGQDLQYLLLMGAGSYDNRKASSPYMLPTYQTEASLSQTSSYCCDDYFGFLEDNEGGATDAQGRYSNTSVATCSVDIGIGRLPVRNAADANAVLKKIRDYSDNRYFGSWKNRLVFLSDDDKIEAKEVDSPNAHMKHNEQMVQTLLAQGHNEFVYQKIYLPAYAQTTSASGTNYPAAIQELNDALQQGALIVNYAGHGNTNSITHEGLMTSAKAAALSMKRLPLWITASCDVARFDQDELSLGETLLLNPDGGAIGLITTTRTVFANNNLALNDSIISHVFDRHADGTRFRLGDVMRAGKRALGSDANKLSFCLLGDPTMTLSYPEHGMELTEINGRPLDGADGGNFALPVMQRITMRGRVFRTGSNETDTEFDGLVYPTLYDAADTLTADKGLWQEENGQPFRFTARTKRIFAGRDAIRGGEFEFSFIAPQDVSYSTLPGLVNLYACSTDGAEGQGYFDRFVMTADDLVASADTLGPVIRTMFLNEPTFVSGDAVNATPYFFAEVEDSTGFNTTGNSIGHDVSLTIRCLSNPLIAVRQYNLNNYFTTYTGAPTKGNVRFSIPALEEGRYEAAFRIWDVNNNPATSRLTFTVDPSNAPQKVVVQAWPNPARQGETVTFRVLHNRPESQTTTRVQIFTQTGLKVWEGESSVSSADVVYPLADSGQGSAMTADESADFLGASTMTWNQQGAGGFTLTPGLYVYRVFLNSAGSDAVSEAKMLMVRGQ